MMSYTAWTAIKKAIPRGDPAKVQQDCDQTQDPSFATYLICATVVSNQKWVKIEAMITQVQSQEQLCNKHEIKKETSGIWGVRLDLTVREMI